MERKRRGGRDQLLSTNSCFLVIHLGCCMSPRWNPSGLATKLARGPACDVDWHWTGTFITTVKSLRLERAIGNVRSVSGIFFS